ncbi:MAG: aminoacyl-tRNA hydrolase [Candidatus Omnitrophica bacterium]|nr:aminoacyl-tRNA hydrolase [Candidatus Omnitrophota bacterium]
MKLIAGLGNPGTTYRDTRHNIGFSVIREIAKTHKISLKRERNISSLTGRGKIEGQDVILALPLTFMNLSGGALIPLFRKYKVEPDGVLIACDDLDLELGRLKVRPTGSSGGHRGLQSVIDSLGDNKFARLRIGIGRPGIHIDAAEYVLSSFTRREKEEIKTVIKEASECCEAWLAKGIVETMNIFNTRRKNE